VNGPLVSVLLPAHDAESTLPAALESLRRQRLERFECIVVDDGSRDGTRAIAERVASRDSRFRIIGIPHSGIVGALEAGLDACRAPYVARMDADDLAHRDRLVLQYRALEARADLAGVGCHVRMFPRAGLTAGRLAYERWLNSVRDEEDVFRQRLIECPIAHPSLFVRTEVLRRFRYRDCGWPEDYDLVLRILESGARLGMVPRRLLFWREGPVRLSRTHPAYALERFVECKAHFIAQGWLARHDRYVLWGYGDTGRTLCRALARYAKLPSAIVELHPGRLGQRIAGAPVIEPDALAALVPRPERIVVSVAGLVARARILAHLEKSGFGPESFVFAA